MKLKEIEVISSLAKREEESFKKILAKANLIQSTNLGDLMVAKFPEFNQEVYLIKIEDKIISYIALEKKEDFWWFMEMWTSEEHRNKGLAKYLLLYAKNEKTQLIADLQMSEDAISMIEKIVKSKEINASILDTKEGIILAYDENHPLYDSKIKNVDRPILTREEKDRYTWVLETRKPRGGILAEYARYGPKL